MSYQRSMSVGHLVNWAARLYARTLEKGVRPLGILLAQVPPLLVLCEETELSQKELVERTATEQPAMVAILKRMEASGSVLRRADPSDGRASLFRLSDRALDSLPPLTSLLMEGNRRALRGFSDGEQAHLLEMLKRLIGNLSVYDQEELGRNSINEVRL